MRKRLAFACLPALLLLTACLEEGAERKQRRATAQLMDEAESQIGMPAIANFQERRMAKQMLELRDQKIATHSYIVNAMRGCLVHLGPSVGFGLPYATQMTNPHKYHVNGATLPQAEPNGLYMPDGAEATWVMLSNPATGKVEPTYVEPELLVSPFRLTAQECKP